MKRAGCYWIVFAVTCLLVASEATSALDNEGTRATLKGLRGVYVLVETMEPDVERLGLTRATLQTDVEVKLRQSGIKVLSRTEGLAAPGQPTLYLNAGVYPPRDVASGPYAYSIHLELDQSVLLERNRAWTIATTWSAGGGIGTVGSNQLSMWVRERVRDQVDQFINAWLSVNPK